MGRKQNRYCVSCGGTHKKPTGLKSQRLQKLEQMDSFSEDESIAEVAAPAAIVDPRPELAVPPRDQERLPKTRGEVNHENRLARIEATMDKIAAIVLKDSPPQAVVTETPRHDDRRRSPSVFSDSSRSRSTSRERRRSRPNRVYSQSRHLERGEIISTFESLMVSTFRTLKEMQEKGLPLEGMINHGLTMSEKAASGAYLDRACISYDASVRQRAQKLGPSAFAVPINEDLIRHFSLENSKRFQTQGQGSKKKKNTCFKFNSETGCNNGNCVYAHRCNSCKIDGHSARDCRMGDRSKPTK